MIKKIFFRLIFPVEKKEILFEFQEPVKLFIISEQYFTVVDELYKRI